MSRVSYTASFKLGAIEFAEKNGNRAAAREYGIVESHVRYWRKQKDSLLHAKRSSLALRGPKKGRYPELEEELFSYVQELSNDGNAVSREMLQFRAKELARAKGISHGDFKASRGWVHRFIRRKNVCPRRTSLCQRLPQDYSDEMMSQSSNECSSYNAIFIKEEPVELDPLTSSEEENDDLFTEKETLTLNGGESTDGINSAMDPPSIKKEPWEPPDGHSSAQDPLSIENEEFSQPEDFRMPSTSSVDGMEAEDDDGGSLSEDCLEEIKVEVELRTDDSESESTAAVDAEDSNSVQDSDGSVTKYNAPYRNESATGNVVHRCAICRKVFANFEDLKEHTHEGSHEIPHSCSICCRSFKRAEHLQKHFRVHSGERPYSCKFCSKKFAERSNLTRHLRVHTGERPYSCLVCNKTFLSSSCLKRHSQVHTGERPHSCSICNKAFMTTTCLKRHSQMHLDKPPHICDVCLRQFKESKSLRLHYRTHMRVQTISL